MITKYKNKTAQDYLQVTTQDPVKRHSQYYTAIQLLGKLAHGQVLDIGCGNGVFAAELASAGASKVVGYDISYSQIKLAKTLYSKLPQLSFIASNPKKFQHKEKFDAATAILVLMNAKNFTELKEFFASAFKHLKDGGKFIGITYNPEFKRYNQPLYRRLWSRASHNHTHLHFLDEAGNTIMTTLARNIPLQEYEDAANVTGFRRLKWKQVAIHPKSLKNKREFWQGFLEDCPYVVFVTIK